MIEVSTVINSTLKDVWQKFTSVENIKYWSFASEDWAAEGIENDLREGGRFNSRNYAKDGSMEFNLSGVYSEVVPNRRLAYTLDDGRKVRVTFEELDGKVKIQQEFEPETLNPESMQRQGWQTYLDNFKKFAESNYNK